MKPILLFGCVALAGAALAQDGPGREKIAGTWDSTDGARWVLDEKPDAVHITEFDHDKKIADYECNTVGKECEVKDGGKSAKVTIYFNGPRLVVMETRGSDVVKRRFEAQGTGNELAVETIPIQPQGKPETVKLARSTTAQK